MTAILNLSWMIPGQDVCRAIMISEGVNRPLILCDVQFFQARYNLTFQYQENTLMTEIVVTGASGRMGQSLIRTIAQDQQARLSAALVRPDSPLIDKPVNDASDLNYASSESLQELNHGVLIDFTLPEHCLNNAETWSTKGLPMIIGTTGFERSQQERLEALSAGSPILISANMSLGVNLLLNLLEVAAQSISSDTLTSVEEWHHIHKVDSPSGTAKLIQKTLEGAGVTLSKPIEAHREGEIVGTHEVKFSTGDEIISLRHEAHDRDIFAKGALKAAHWLVSKPAGLYSIRDLLSGSSD